MKRQSAAGFVFLLGMVEGGYIDRAVTDQNPECIAAGAIYVLTLLALLVWFVVGPMSIFKKRPSSQLHNQASPGLVLQLLSHLQFVYVLSLQSLKFPPHLTTFSECFHGWFLDFAFPHVRAQLGKGVSFFANIIVGFAIVAVLTTLADVARQPPKRRRLFRMLSFLICAFHLPLATVAFQTLRHQPSHPPTHRILSHIVAPSAILTVLYFVHPCLCFAAMSGRSRAPIIGSSHSTVGSFSPLLHRRPKDGKISIACARGGWGALPLWEVVVGLVPLKPMPLFPQKECCSSGCVCCCFSGGLSRMWAPFVWAGRDTGVAIVLVLWKGSPVSQCIAILVVRAGFGVLHSISFRRTQGTNTATWTLEALLWLCGCLSLGAGLLFDHGGGWKSSFDWTVVGVHIGCIFVCCSWIVLSTRPTRARVARDSMATVESQATMSSYNGTTTTGTTTTGTTTDFGLSFNFFSTPSGRGGPSNRRMNTGALTPTQSPVVQRIRQALFSDVVDVHRAASSQPNKKKPQKTERHTAAESVSSPNARSFTNEVDDRATSPTFEMTTRASEDGGDKPIPSGSDASNRKNEPHDTDLQTQAKAQVLTRDSIDDDPNDSTDVLQRASQTVDPKHSSSCSSRASAAGEHHNVPSPIQSKNLLQDDMDDPVDFQERSNRASDNNNTANRHRESRSSLQTASHRFSRASTRRSSSGSRYSSPSSSSPQQVQPQIQTTKPRLGFLNLGAMRDSLRHEQTPRGAAEINYADEAKGIFERLQQKKKQVSALLGGHKLQNSRASVDSKTATTLTQSLSQSQSQINGDQNPRHSDGPSPPPSPPTILNRNSTTPPPSPPQSQLLPAATIAATSSLEAVSPHHVSLSSNVSTKMLGLTNHKSIPTRIKAQAQSDQAAPPPLSPSVEMCPSSRTNLEFLRTGSTEEGDNQLSTTTTPQLSPPPPTAKPLHSLDSLDSEPIPGTLVPFGSNALKTTTEDESNSTIAQDHSVTEPVGVQLFGEDETPVIRTESVSLS